MTDITQITELIKTKGLCLVNVASTDSSLLGEGYFGKVYKAKHTTDGQYYAIKIINIPKYILKLQYGYTPIQKTIFELKKEITFLAEFNHPHVVSYRDCWFGGPEAEYYKDLEKKDLEFQDKQPSYSSTTTQILDFREASLFIKMGYCHSNLREWIDNNDK